MYIAYTPSYRYSHFHVCNCNIDLEWKEAECIWLVPGTFDDGECLKECIIILKGNRS
jgi:hypothetical protein